MLLFTVSICGFLFLASLATIYTATNTKSSIFFYLFQTAVAINIKTNNTSYALQVFFCPMTDIADAKCLEQQITKISHTGWCLSAVLKSMKSKTFHDFLLNFICLQLCVLTFFPSLQCTISFLFLLFIEGARQACQTLNTTLQIRQIPE